MSRIKKNEKEKRFEFGKNWHSFLSRLNKDRIVEAEKSLCECLDLKDLNGLTFLDIGSGSGLFSLAARRLGAMVHSFDFDIDSVQCTRELKNKYFPSDDDWIIEQGSVLDRSYMESLGQFDICYSWGVLHHTGNLWQAVYNSQLAVKKDGSLFIAVYNDQGMKSAVWSLIKEAYCSTYLGKVCLTAIFFPAFFISGFFIDLCCLRNPYARYREHIKIRGMSLVHDWKDWLGGYPFEPAKPEKIIRFCENIGFQLSCLKKPQHGFGNNQFVFRNPADGMKPVPDRSKTDATL